MSAYAPYAHRRALTPTRGLSIVELMVGITIALFILAGATTVATSQLGDSKRLMLEAQVQQDLRLTMDMVVRDLRRAAYWGRTDRAVWPETVVTALANPYVTLTPDNAGTSTSIEFVRSTDEDGQPLGVSENTQVDPAEYGGFRLNVSDQTMEIRLGGQNTWQTLTDKNVLQLTAFNVAVESVEKPVPDLLGPGGCPMVQVVRDAVIELRGQATHDASVKRSLRSAVRLRNDLVVEKC